METEQQAHAHLMDFIHEVLRCLDFQRAGTKEPEPEQSHHEDHVKNKNQISPLCSASLLLLSCVSAELQTLNRIRHWSSHALTGL